MFTGQRDCNHAGSNFDRAGPPGFEQPLDLGHGLIISMSIGGKSGRITVGSRGSRATAHIPGTHASYSTPLGRHGRRKAQQKGGGSALVGFVALGLIVWFLLHLAGIA